MQTINRTNTIIRFWGSELSYFVVIILCLLLVPIISKQPYLLHLCVITGIYMIFSVGYNLVASITNQISFGHAGLYAVAGYGTALLGMKAGLPFLINIPLAVIISIITSFILGLTSFRVKDFALSIVTLAFGWVIYSILWNWTDMTGGQNGLILSGASIASIGSIKLTGWHFLYIVIGLLIISFIVTRNLVYSRTGRAFSSIRTSEIAAEALGVNTLGYKLMVFIISGIFAGFAGALYAQYVTFIDPTLATVDSSFALMVILLIGGWGTLLGPLLGAVVYVFLPAYMGALAKYWAFLWGVFLLAILLLAPQGILGRFKNKLSAHQIVPSGEKLDLTAFLSKGKDDPIPKLELFNVSKAFGGVRAVDNLSLTITGGIIHSIIGPDSVSI